MFKSLKSGLVVAAVLAGAVAGVPAQAAVEPAASDSVEVIVVTAQRRAEKVTDVPASITAVTGATLDALGVKSVDQLANLVPGLSFSNTGPIPVFSIRGITLNDYGFTNESPIALYVDDIYMAAPGSASSQMFDIDRVDVLRGPQGTLFGRNATGGLIQVVSKKPTADVEGEASIQYGSYNQVVATGALGGPISDRFRVRAAFTYDRDDGWQKNVVTNTRQAKTDVWAARVIADLDVTSRLSAETNVHGGIQDNVTPGYYNRGEFDPLSFAPCATADILANACVSPFGSRDPNPNPRTVYSDVANPPNRNTTLGASETLTYTADDYTVTSISAYEFSDKYYMEDSDGSPDPLIQSSNTVKRSQYSQELRLNGQTERMRWVVGGFLFYESERDGFVTLQQIVPLYGTYGNQDQYFQSSHSAAMFGQVDYDLAPDVIATGGLRYTSERKSLTISDDFAAPTFVDHDRASADRLTWKAGLQWHFQPDWLLYANVSTGFKSPASNTTLIFQGGGIAAKPEKDTNYEIGVKGEAFDHRLQISAAGFYLAYRDFQLITIPPGSTGATSVLLNAKSATIYGVDGEINAVPVDDLTLNLSGTWLHTRSDSPGLFIGSFPVTGAQLAYSPQWSVKGFARYDWEFASMGVLSPHLDFSYNSRAQSQPVADPLAVIPSHLLLNAGLRFAPAGSNVALDAFIDNLTDKEYINYAGDFSGYNILQWGRPRTFGIRLSTRF